MTPAELDVIEARLKAATPGPWVAPCGALGTDVRTLGGASVADDVKRADDADFIAHAPTDIAALLAEVRRLTPAVKVARWDGRELRDASGKVLAWYSREAARFVRGHGTTIYATGVSYGVNRGALEALADEIERGPGRKEGA